MSVTLIAALAKNGVIGCEGKLPFYCPEDLRWFKNKTKEKTIIMGRKTFESIGRALPKRTNIVVTSGLQKNETIRQNPGIITMPTPQMAINVALLDGEDVFIIGGGEIYEQTIDLADRLLITHFNKECEGDVTFPHIDPSVWCARLVKEGEETGTDLSYAFYEYLRH